MKAKASAIRYTHNELPVPARPGQAVSRVFALTAFAFAFLVLPFSGASADERTDKLYQLLKTQIARKLEVQNDKTRKPKERRRRLSEINAAITGIRRTLFDLNVERREIDEKIKQFEKMVVKRESEPQYNETEKSEIKKIRARLANKKANLKKVLDKDGFVAHILEKQIKRLENMLEEIRKQALRRPPKPKPKKIVVRLKMNVALRAAMRGEIAKVVKNKVITRAIKRKRPWKLEGFRDRFENPKTFDALRDTYNSLQDAMRATLLIKREQWTFAEATNHTGQLSSIAARLKFVEQQVLFHLARLSPQSPAAREMAKLEKDWLALVAKEQAILKRLRAIRKEQLAIMKKHKLKPGDVGTAGGAGSDWAVRRINELEAQFRKIVKQEWQPNHKAIGDKQNERAKKLAAQDNEIVAKATAYLEQTKSTFKVHTKLGRDRSTKIYEQFLYLGNEVNTFYQESTKRYRVTKTVR